MLPPAPRPAARRLLLLSLLSLSATRALQAQAWELCQPLQVLAGEVANDRMGWIIGDAGDVDGDGKDDLVVSSPFHAAGGPNAGRVYVFSGATGASLHVFSGTTGERFGSYCAGIGDLDGDGRPELLVGAPAPGTGTPGQAYVFSGQSGNLLYSYSGEAADDQFGFAIHSVGDVDGDNVPDFLVGADLHDSGANNAGRAYLYSGASGGLLTVITGSAAGERLGAGVGPAGDRNADGRADYLIGRPGAQPDGAMDVYDGQSGQLVCSHVGDAGATGVFASYFCESVGDVDADGIEDYFASDWGDSTLVPGGGKAYVWSGASCSLLYRFQGESSTDAFGGGHAGVGDVDGDGHADLMFCAWSSDDGGQNAGKTVLYSGADGSELGRYTGDTGGEWFGSDVCGMGDLDGDGRPDFAISSTQPGTSSPGVVYLISSDPAPPRRYCDGGQNSLGRAARLGYRRSLSLGVNDFRLRVDDAVPGAAGQFFLGEQAQDLPFGDGRLCVRTHLVRIATPVSVTASGSKQITLDFSSAQLAGAILAGQRRCFQFWYRDPAAGPGHFNTSDAISASFCP